jgi:hypothetical protein
MSYHIYCLNYGDKRTATITASFDAVGLSDKVTLCPGVSAEIVKAANNYLEEVLPYYYLVTSVTLGHISMMKMFLETSKKEYGIFCENDIRMHKDIKNKLPYYLGKMKELNLEILRLGYFMLSENVSDLEEVLPTIHKEGIIHSIYGAQMYVLNRSKCKEYIKKYTIDFFLKYFRDPSRHYYYPDNTIVKDGNTGLVYPMLTVEYIPDNWKSEHGDDTEYQTKSSKFNLTDDYY